MLYPVKLTLAPFEAEYLRRYLRLMYELTRPDNTKETARAEVILLAECYPSIDKRCSTLSFNPPKRDPTFKIPLSAALILWYRWQKEPANEITQMILWKIDSELLSMKRRPEFQTRLL